MHGGDKCLTLLHQPPDSMSSVIHQSSEGRCLLCLPTTSRSGFSPSLRSPSTAWSRDTTGQQRDSRNSRRPLGDSYGDGAPMNGSRAGSRPRTPSSHFTVQLPPVLPSGRRSRRVSPIQITADRSHARPTTSAFHTPTVSQSPQHQPCLLYTSDAADE